MTPTPTSGPTKLALPTSRMIIKCIIGAFLACLMTAPTRAAQEQSVPSDREAVKQLLQRVEQLENRIKELEAKQNDTAAKTSPQPQPESVQKTQAEPADPARAQHAGHDAPATSPFLQIRGFGDIQYQASDLNGSTNSFLLGQLNLFATSRLSEQLSVLAEMVIEANDENEFGFEIERLMLQYHPADYLNLSVGRYHTNIGYYNTAYHHGTWFQTAVGRPFLFEFEDEGGILPIHNVGLSASGLIPSGKAGLHYVAEIGNGRHSRTPLGEPVQNVVDDNNGKAFNLGLYARPAKVPGLQAGFSVYRDHLTREGLPKIGQTIFAGHAVYTTPSFEFLNEGVFVRNAPETDSNPFVTSGFYTQISKRFQKARPYFRYQYVNVPAADPIIGDVGRQNGPSFGLRYDVGEFAALKAQYDRTFRRNLPSVNGVTLQLAFTF